MMLLNICFPSPLRLSPLRLFLHVSSFDNTCLTGSAWVYEILLVQCLGWKLSGERLNLNLNFGV